jgi:hypothetical protein
MQNTLEIEAPGLRIERLKGAAQDIAAAANA